MIAGIVFDRFTGAALVLIALAWANQLRIHNRRQQRRKWCDHCEMKGNDDECGC